MIISLNLFFYCKNMLIKLYKIHMCWVQILFSPVFLFFPSTFFTFYVFEKNWQVSVSSEKLFLAKNRKIFDFCLFVQGEMIFVPRPKTFLYIIRKIHARIKWDLNKIKK